MNNQQQPINIPQNITPADLANAETICCKNCKGLVFNGGIIVKKTSALSRIGEKLVNIPVLYCVNCGAVVKETCPIPL